MLTDRKFQIGTLYRITRTYWLCMTAYSVLAVILYTYCGMTWLRIPWPVLAVIGTAVAFYIGFKNNSSYDRQWEARKIWGSMVNSSRSWAMMVKDYVSDTFVDDSIDESELRTIHRELVYRHIAWLYCLRRQLWRLQPWEHNRPHNQRFRKYYSTHFSNRELSEELGDFLASDEVSKMLSYKNPATQLIAKQSRRLNELRKQNLIDDFRHVEMTNLLVKLYDHQGKCERIKNYPFPRQYANSSILFVVIFLALVPFGVISQFQENDLVEMGRFAPWMTVPFSLLIGWVYWIMELVGDYAENPFAGLALDTPMTALCRSIEIDLRDMLGETDLPAPIQPVDGVLL